MMGELMIAGVVISSPSMVIFTVIASYAPVGIPIIVTA